MKKLRRTFCVAFMCALFICGNAYAAVPTWESLPGHHNLSSFLNENQKYSEDIINGYARGTIFSVGILRITNQEDGTLFISADTAAHRDVDCIYQTVFLDEWDEEREDWSQIGYWEFVRNKEEEDDGELSAYHVAFTVSGCVPNRYYRARAMHLVQLGDKYEGKATETDGVLLTTH